MLRIRMLFGAVLAVQAIALAVASVGSAAASEGATALPDGRVYEQASSPRKNGNEAGVNLRQGRVFGGYAAAAPGGGAVAYSQPGPSGETSSGIDLYSVSSRNSVTGWETSAAVPPPDLPNADFAGVGPSPLL